MHLFCHEEALAIATFFGGGFIAVKYYVFRVRNWFHKRNKCYHDNGEIKS